MNAKEQLEQLNNMFSSGSIEVDRALSYSRLSDFDRNGPSALVRRNQIDNYGAKIGSIVDDITIPVEGFKLEDNYTISDAKKPTATSGKLADIIIDNYEVVPSNEDLIAICRANDFWKRSNDEVVLKNIIDNDVILFAKDNLKASDKPVITNDDLLTARNLSHILKSHPNSRDIFRLEGNIYQYALRYEYNGVILRGYIDIVNIDHENKTIQIIDLKTGAGTASDFFKSFVSYRYYLQEAVYQAGAESILKDLDLEGYEVLPFKFLYIGRGQKVPVVINTTEKWSEAALNGFVIEGEYRRGLDELIEDAKWHFSSGQFTFERGVIENNGQMNLDDRIIELK